MRVLTSSVLVMQAIVLGLAIPVVLVARELPAWVGWLLAGLALAALLLPAMVRRPWFVPAGLGAAGRDDRLRGVRADAVHPGRSLRRAVVGGAALRPEGRRSDRGASGRGGIGTLEVHGAVAAPHDAPTRSGDRPPLG